MAVIDQPGYVARIVHQTPGRLRLRLPRELVNGRGAERLHEALAGLAGVQHVRLTPQASSLLVQYDPARVAPEALAATLQRAGVHLAPATAPAPSAAEPTALGQLIDRLAGQLNERVDRATGHLLDLRTLLPVGLGALALREVLAGRVQAAPWYVLLWWSFDAYLKLRRRAPNASPPPADPL